MMSTPTDRAQFARETSARGDFVRQQSAFRRTVSTEPNAEFPAEPGRYHLYVCYACPWAHRTIIARALKQLDDVVGMTAVDPIRDERGWAFRDGDGHSLDPVNGFQFLREAYVATDPTYEDRVTTPTLWDTATGQVVSNESEDIFRMLNSEWNEWAGNPELDLYPEAIRDQIDAMNDLVYKTVNNGVYRCGFATTQDAYERAVGPLFDALDELEERLGTQRYLVGDTITEADWRLWVTLLRFDSVYVSHFKCSRRRIVDYPNLWDYTRELYQWPGVAATVNMDHIKRHYYVTHHMINPTQIVPVGPAIDLTVPHTRAQ